MLARANRVVRPEDFRAVMRRGRRATSPLAVYYSRARSADDPVRFGFIVSRAVGGAVERNRVRRRLRALGREYVDGGARGADVVVRALPAIAAAGWPALSADVHTMLDTELVRE